MAWLIGRFAAFEKTYPNLSVYLNAAPKSVSNNVLSVYDIEVVYTADRKEIDEKFHLLDEFLLPVCSSSYAEKHTMELQNLSDHRLLLNSPEANDWRPWLKHHDFISSDIKPMLKKAISLPTDANAIEMAVGGYGIALANLHYVLEKLEKGILIPAFNIDAFLLGVHYLRYNDSYTSSTAKTLIKWLSKEAQNSSLTICKWKRLRKYDFEHS
jgi:DNA-binding transcriptional LysR family regulator